MSVFLPYDPASWPSAKIYAQNSWGHSWKELPSITGGKAGTTLLRVRRATLPEPDEAVFRFRYGQIDGVEYAKLILTPRSFIRVDIDEKTVFVGFLVAQRTSALPGSSIQAGEVEFHASGILSLLETWKLDRHQCAGLGAIADENPGYNIGGRKDRADDGMGLGYYAHDEAGGTYANAYWTDSDAIKHALLCNDAPLIDPVISFSDLSGALSSSQEWQVTDGETVAEFLKRVLNRQRGIGVAFFEFSAEGQNITLTVLPSVMDSISYNGVTAYGAGNTGTHCSVDLIGDHRLGPNGPASFEISEIQDQGYDAVEVLGERIQVMVSLRSGEHLDAKWTEDLQTMYDLGPPDDETNNEWQSTTAPVFQHYGLTVSSGCIADSYSSGLGGRFDYACGALGEVKQSPNQTPTYLCSILPDLPILAGYSYITGEGEPETPGDHPRTPIRVWSYAGGNWTRLNADAETSLNISVKNNTLAITGISGARFGEIYADVLVTLCVELPHRLRMLVTKSGRTFNGRMRKRRVYVSGLSLHLSHHGAVYGSDENGVLYTFDGSQTSPFVLRNDSNEMKVAAAAAKRWYLQERRTASWSLHACGLNDGWFSADPETGEQDEGHAWPQLGHVVQSLAAGGETKTIDTPITFIEYNHTTGITSWSTGWSDRDWIRGAR